MEKVFSLGHCRGGDFASTTKKGPRLQNISAGLETCWFESTRTQILALRDRDLSPREGLGTSGFRNWETPPSWKRIAIFLPVCRTVGSLSASRRMRSQIKNRDIPDQMLSSTGDME